MDNPKIFIFAEPDGAAECNAKLKSYSCDLTVGSADWHSPQGNNEEEMIGLASDAQALLGTSIRSSPITRKIMEASPELRVVAKCTVGTDDVDVEAATELGILVCHAPTESNCYGVAEGTVAFILASVKKLSQRDAQVKDGKWRDPNLMGSYLGRRSTDNYPGMTLGIIGLGRIGARVAQLFAPWRMRIIACDPYISDERFIRNGVEKVDLDTLLRESDAITAHVPAIPSTVGMFNCEAFRKMKPDALFINAARGKVHHEADLVEALKSGEIAGAALDVFEDEPLTLDSPLFALPNVILTPHKAGQSEPSMKRMSLVTEDVVRVLKGEDARWAVNRPASPR
ncbi:MAG: hydroxyacid dehydrogenase [Candidatus Poribacteria bacterium]|nr:hydroxyacid dehydrogenase [Candidatus Poribacteria bacterium]